jgi:hypothetical protein
VELETLSLIGRNECLFTEDLRRCDTDFSEIVQASSFLEKGLREITFSGLKPTGFLENSTTIVYRENNCFNI